MAERRHTLQFPRPENPNNQARNGQPPSPLYAWLANFKQNCPPWIGSPLHRKTSPLQECRCQQVLIWRALRSELVGLSCKVRGASSSFQGSRIGPTERG